MNADAISVKGMRFWGRHGVTEEERANPQEIEVDIELIVDCAPAAASDRLADAVDYHAVFRACERVVTQQSFALLEAIAGACLGEIMRDARVQRASASVRKPQLLDGATPEVRLTRAR